MVAIVWTVALAVGRITNLFQGQSMLYQFIFIIAFTASPCFISWVEAAHDNSAAIRLSTDSSSDRIHDDVFDSNVDRAVQQAMKQHRVPGSAVVIVRNGKTIFNRGYGQANIERSIPVDPDKTLFRIGSISKALTLLTITRLVDDGRLKMDDDVSKIFPGIKNSHGFKEPVTIQNLLTHTSGFDQIGGRDRQVRNFDQTLAERKAARTSIADFLRANRLRRVNPAGEFYRYDTYGTTLAGAIIESRTGKAYADAMKVEMFAPLGMKNTFVEADSEHLPDLATGYEMHDGRNMPQPYEVYVTTPASSIDSTAADMGRLLEALTGKGANEHGRLFSSGTARAVLAPQFRPHPEFSGVTHGLHESFNASGQFAKPVRTVDHGGTMLGFQSQMAIIPQYNVGVFVVTNQSGGRNPLGAAVMRAVVESLPDVPKRRAIAVPERDLERDLSEFVGDYYYGVYCHECTSEELAAGAWRRGPSRAVTSQDGALTIGNDQYLPRGDDVFVRSDGENMVYFGRNDQQKISFFVYASSPDTFERED